MDTDPRQVPEWQAAMIEALRVRKPFPGPGGPVELFETHVSWVLLAGAYAYKIKKAIDLGFLDYRETEARRFFCEEELRLNRRGAPGLYLDVIPLTGTPGTPHLGGPGPAIDYALRMKRFEQSRLLGRILADSGEPAGLADRLAERVAAFHAAIPPLKAAQPYGAPGQITATVGKVLANLDELLVEPADRDLRHQVAGWLAREGRRREGAFLRRREGGRIRECHGDLHCDNVVVGEDTIALFDGIEFSRELRSVDVISDLAFLLMDLQARGHPATAWQCLNRYLEITGDYGALAVLRYYLCYRALVRCMVEFTRARQSHADPAAAQRRGRGYLALAHRCTLPGGPAMVLTHGLSGSGKSTLAMAFCRLFGAIRVRSDVERGRLAADSPGGPPKYSEEMTDATYRRLEELAVELTAAGWLAVVDATFQRRALRRRFRELAATRGLPFAIVDFRAPPELLRRRVAARSADARDASEADLAVQAQQLAEAQPLAPDELGEVVGYDASRPLDVAATGGAWAPLWHRLGLAAPRWSTPPLAD